MNNSPTEKQIKFAEEIARAFDLDFPHCSAEYNKYAYQQFISYYYNQYRELMASDPTYDDDEMMWYDPWAEGGY